jgi:glycerol-3-phosphate O-acyltransferase
MDTSATPPPGPAAPSPTPDPATPPVSLRTSTPLWARWMEKLLAPWIEIKREPAVPPFVVDRPICYVLENYGLSNALILDRACREAGLPSPMAPLPGDPLGRKRAYIALSRRGGSALGGPRNKTHSDGLSRLLQQHRQYPDQDVQLVPVSIFVGRAPAKQSGWFSVLFSENWAIVGRFRRMLAILLNGRDTVVQFSPSVRVWEILSEDLPHERTVRKTARVLRAHFRRIRAAVIGPDLSTRRLLVDRVLDGEPVRKAITDQARRDGSEYLEAWKKAHGFAWEIAADYSNPVVRSLSFMLTGFWNRVYDGVTIHHLDALKQLAPGHEIVYVPCHRSHMDYLLLSYLLYQHGIVPPHIAAGDNLNLPVIGSLLRRGGAFFLRRSIRNNALYSAVFSEYVAQLVGDGFPMEYFIEGGRSRTGRLLAPKGGMIAMTVRGFLRAPRRPVVFQPVYIGYERLVEGDSYPTSSPAGPRPRKPSAR